MVSFGDLPDEIIELVLTRVHPCDLQSFGSTSRRLRRLVCSQFVMKGSLASVGYSLPAGTCCIDLPTLGYLAHSCECVDPELPEQIGLLGLEGVYASSTDHDFEDITNTTKNSYRYWSSTSNTADSTELLIYRIGATAHPSLVSKLSITAYQRGPVFSWPRLQFAFFMDFPGAGVKPAYTTRIFSCRSSTGIQELRLKSPILCKYICFVLIGKHNREVPTSGHYVCVQSVSANGVELDRAVVLPADVETTACRMGATRDAHLTPLAQRAQQGIGEMQVLSRCPATVDPTWLEWLHPRRNTLGGGSGDEQLRPETLRNCDFILSLEPDMAAVMFNRSRRGHVFQPQLSVDATYDAQVLESLANASTAPGSFTIHASDWELQEDSDSEEEELF